MMALPIIIITIILLMLALMPATVEMIANLIDTAF